MSSNQYTRECKEDKPVLAICYDFDKTLSPDDMQAQGYIQSVGYDVGEFWSINIGERIFEKISTGLCESKALIMIISKDYLKSVCCTDEWGAFYGKVLHDKSCVIYPIIIDDSVPPALISQIKYLRFNDDEYTSALSTLLRSLRKQFSK